MTASDTCDRCEKTQEGIAWFAAAYRKKELRHGRPDPGNLCGACAGSDTGKRIGELYSGGVVPPLKPGETWPRIL